MSRNDVVKANRLLAMRVGEKVVTSCLENFYPKQKTLSRFFVDPKGGIP